MHIRQVPPAEANSNMWAIIGTSDDRDAFAKAATQLPDTTYAELAWNRMRSETSCSTWDTLSQSKSRGDSVRC